MTWVVVTFMTDDQGYDVSIHANLAILATPVCFIGHQVYVLDCRWLSSLLDKLDISC